MHYRLQPSCLKFANGCWRRYSSRAHGSRSTLGLSLPHQKRSPQLTLGIGWTEPVFSSHAVTDRKSTFLAHASRVSSAEDVYALLEHLQTLTTSPRLTKATHCMWAWPSTASGITNAGQNNGGESGAGERLARLLELSDCKDAAVVVWRWYGGVPLGSNRWKCISTTAKDALRKGGFMS
jgi:hypothetical protein